MLLSFAIAALARYRLSALSTGLMLALWAGLAADPVWFPFLLWSSSGLVGLVVWYSLEPALLRLWGRRAPSARERARVEPALRHACASLGVDREPTLLVDDEPAIASMAGLRTVVVARGALEMLDDHQLAGFVAHEVGHLRARDTAGPPLVWLGNLPLVGLRALTRAVARLGRLLALVVGAALVVPLLLCPDGFTRLVGRLFTIALTLLLALGLLAAGTEGHQRGVLAAGAGLCAAWALVPGLRLLLAWEGRRCELAADRAAVAAGYGEALLEALEVVRSLEEAPASGPAAVLLGWHPATELRIDALARLLDATAKQEPGGRHAPTSPPVCLTDQSER